MRKLLIPILAAIVIYVPAPSLAASDVTDVSAARKHPAARSARVKPSQVRVNRAAVRGPVRVNRAVVRGPRGVTRAAVVRPGRLTVGPGRAVARPARLGGVPTVVLRGNRVATIYRGPRRIWWGGRWRVYAPLAALGVVAIAGAYYYPDAYLAVGRPYCQGIAPNGCRLNWQLVAFEDGGDDGWQCVQYCPRPGVPPPAKTVALAAPPPLAAPGKCDITIYSEPKFASAAVPTGDDQPRLSESGWRNQIASIEIKAGTWELFSDEQYSGNAMRLGPGSYPELAPDWTKKIGSFMCVEPGN
jgi:hypothetical protein